MWVILLKFFFYPSYAGQGGAQDPNNHCNTSSEASADMMSTSCLLMFPLPCGHDNRSNFQPLLWWNEQKEMEKKKGGRGRVSWDVECEGLCNAKVILGFDSVVSAKWVIVRMHTHSYPSCWWHLNPQKLSDWLFDTQEAMDCNREV